MMSHEPGEAAGNYDPEVQRRPRVVQWGTGNVGSRALRHAIEHPDLDLVGVYVTNPDKVGRDAGSLCGLAPVGVAATGSVDDVIALAPDCVLYMPLHLDFDEVCRLLEAGANVVTTRTEFQNPATLPPGMRERVEDACRRGNASIHGTGSSPGFVTEALPIVLLSIQRRFDCLTIYEFANNAPRNSPEMLFDVMGFGATPGTGVSAAALGHMREAFGGTLMLLAEAIGLPIDEVVITGSEGIARSEVVIAAGTIPAGSVAALRFVVSGLRNGKALMRFIATWYVSAEVETSDGEDWDFRNSGWRILLEGDCPLDVGITFPVAPADFAQMTPGLTANRPINMVRTVCGAPPGIQTTVDLPQIIAQFA